MFDVNGKSAETFTKHKDTKHPNNIAWMLGLGQAVGDSQSAEQF